MILVLLVLVVVIVLITLAATVDDEHMFGSAHVACHLKDKVTDEFVEEALASLGQAPYPHG